MIMGIPVTQRQNKKTTIIRKPVLNQVHEYECKITYFDGKKWINTIKENYSDINAINVFAGIREALNKRPAKGNISKKEAIKLLQKVFENGYDMKKIYGDKSNDSSGCLVAIKELFELYMDKDSDGGENITQKEQFAIMRTIDKWY